MKLTEMQKNAVISPVSDILVTAAAGSGKTQVLTGRIMNRIINENADISRMLIITFTNAAATEMRSRISKKITEAVTENPRQPCRGFFIRPGFHRTTSPGKTPESTGKKMAGKSVPDNFPELPGNPRHGSPDSPADPFPIQLP